MERGTIEVAPLAFMRGRTLNDSFIILDEAQNTTPEQMQMFLTRLGFGSKVVVTGDVTQIDLPREQASGLIQVQDILGAIDGIAFVELQRTRTSSGTSSCSASSRPTSSTRRRPAPRAGSAVVAVEVDEPKRRGRRRAAAVELRARVARRRGRGGRRARHRASSGRTRCARSSASISVSTRRPTCCRSRSTAREALPAGLPRQLGDVVLCPAGRRRGVARTARPRAAAPARLRPRRRDGAPARRR